MKMLGIDYGTKRIGLAISDETGTLARELAILAPKQFWREIENLVADNKIEQLVVGLPLNMSGGPTEKSREVGVFADKLKQKLAIPIELMDERLSSSMARNLPGGQTNVDSLAAQIILQNYLDKNKQ